MPQLDVRLLGSLQLKQDGQKSLTGFKSNKVRALLAYLVVEATRPHQRRRLAALLWPEISESKALTNLRYALSNLRKVIGDHAAQPPYLIITPQTIQYNQDSNTLVDVNEFERSVKLAQAHPLDIDSLHQAAELYRGSFLEGFAIPDSIPFEEWLLVKRERLERLVNWVFQRLADEYELAGEYAKAVEFAKRQLHLNPWREEVHQQIMRCLYYLGQRSAAIAQYEACCSALKADLGLEPSQETQTLYTQICEDQLPIPPTPPRFLQRLSLTVVDKPDFVGRQEPLQRLHRALNLAMHAQGQLMLITGSPGQGKTALMREFIRQAMDAHPALAATWGNSQAYFGSGDPFLPFREILEMLSGHVEHRWRSGSMTQAHARRMWRLTEPCARALVQEGPALINTFVPGPPLLARVSQVVQNKHPWLVELETRVSEQSRTRRTSQEDIFQQYWRVLSTISHQVPLLLFVDDLQWADRASLGLFFYLSRQLSTAPLLLVGAFRPVEDQAAVMTDEPSLGAMVTELRLRHGDLLINLDAYTQREFIDAYLDLEPNHLGENFRKALFQFTHSQPLYTVEMLHGMRERGDLVKDQEGTWVASESLNWEQLPPRVEAAIEARMRHWRPVTLHLLKIASVEGEHFTGEVVAQVDGQAEVEVLRLLNAKLEQSQGLVQAESSQRVDGNRLSRYRFRHILIQKFLYNQFNVVEKAALHEKVGESLEELYASRLDEICVPLAVHFELGGNLSKAIHYLDLAGQKAIRLSSYDNAIIHFEKALSLLARQSEGDEKNQLELRLLMHLSTPMRFRSGYATMDFGSVCDRMLELLNSVVFKSEMFPVLNALFDYFDLVGEYQRALSIFERIKTLSDRKLDLWANLEHWGDGCILLSLGKFEESAYHSQKMVDFYDIKKHGELRQIYGSDPGVSSLINYAWALYPLGYPQQAIARCQQAIDLSNQLNDLDNQLFSQIFSAYLFMMMRELGKSHELTQSCKKLLEGQSATIFSAMMVFIDGVNQSYQGDKQLGLANISLGIDNLQSLGMRGRLSVHLAIQSEVLLMLGHIDKASDCLRQAENFIKETTEGIYPAEVKRLKGECLRCKAQDKEAELCFLQAQEMAREQKAKSIELRVAMSLARLWQRQGRVADAYRVLADVFSWFTEGFQTHDLQEAQSLLEELRVNL
jgi:DNA-binding SARP family transcriptional activator